MIEYSQEVEADTWLVVVDVARREDRHLAGSAVTIAYRPRNRRPRLLGEACARERRQLALAVHAEQRLHRAARSRHCVGLVDHLHDHRNRRDLAQLVGARERAIPKARFATLELLRLGTQHQVRKVDVPRMWRNVRDTWSCSRYRTGSTGRRPSCSRPSPHRPSRRCCPRRSGRTTWETRCTGSRSDGNRGRSRRCARVPCRPMRGRRTRNRASRWCGEWAPRGCLPLKSSCIHPGRGYRIATRAERARPRVRLRRDAIAAVERRDGRRSNTVRVNN